MREAVSEEQLFLALYAGKPRPPMSNVLTVHMCKVRKKLAKHGIHLRHDYLGPYFLSAIDRARLREWSD